MAITSADADILTTSGAKDSIATKFFWPQIRLVRRRPLRVNFLEVLHALIKIRRAGRESITALAGNHVWIRIGGGQGCEQSDAASVKAITTMKETKEIVVSDLRILSSHTPSGTLSSPAHGESQALKLDHHHGDAPYDGTLRRGVGQVRRTLSSRKITWAAQ